MSSVRGGGDTQFRINESTYEYLISPQINEVGGFGVKSIDDRCQHRLSALVCRVMRAAEAGLLFHDLTWRDG